MNELELLKTQMPTKAALEQTLSKYGLKRHSGAGPHYQNYEKAKNILNRFWNLSGHDYDQAIKIITDYLQH